MKFDLATLLPAPVRKVLYGLLGVFATVEPFLNLVDDGVEAKVYGIAIGLGFGLALKNVREPLDY